MLFLKATFLRSTSKVGWITRNRENTGSCMQNLKVTGEMCDYHLYPGSRKSYDVRSPGFALQNNLTWSKHERTTTTAADIVRSSRFLCKAPPKLANRSSYFYNIDLRTNETETWREFVLHSTRLRDVFNGQNLNAPLEWTWRERENDGSTLISGSGSFFTSFLSPSRYNKKAAP
jgi:hypothetical protein